MIIPHLILCFLWIRSQIYCFWHNVSVPWLNLFLYGLKDDLCQKSSHPLSLSLSHHHSLNEEAWGSVTHRSTCSLTCLYLRASARSKRTQPLRPTTQLWLILSAGGLTTELVCVWKWASAWSSTPTSQTAFMAVRADVWNNALDWQTFLPACPHLTSHGGRQFRLFSSGQ